MSVPFWQKLFVNFGLNYGNWGGPGWSAGGLRESYSDDLAAKVLGVDSLDEIFRMHDIQYRQAFLYPTQTDVLIRCADLWLLEKLKVLPENPKHWKRPPITCANWWAWGYRKIAILAFRIKSYLGRG
jgi:hypothetical protein